jgi:branched-chain amino acid transport system ATP-binding protein
VLSVQGLTKSFDGFLAVKNVSFEVAEGEILGLIGPNGSGKSTTFNLIAGAFRPTSGSVRFLGEEIGGEPAYRVAHSGIARTHQIPKPFRKLSILDNVALAAFYGRNQTQGRQKAYEVARDCLDLVGLRGERVDGLGAAGLKKLELARALATQPKLLLADESLGGLDHSEMDQAAELLSTIRKKRGITIVWVEHIMGVLMRVVDRCVVLDHGEVIAHGKPDEVARDPKVIEVYLGTDAPEVQAYAARR